MTPTDPVRNRVCCLDLEMNQPSGRIIQIGAVVGALFDEKPPARFSILVNPGEPISPFIEELTGISDGDIEARGRDLIEAVKAFIAFVSAEGGDGLPVTWGGDDLRELREQYAESLLAQNSGEDPCSGIANVELPFGRRVVDIKTIVQAWLLARGRSPKGGLAKALTLAGLSFEGRKHDALDDAFNTFRLARHILGRMQGLDLGISENERKEREAAERARRTERVRELLGRAVAQRGLSAVAVFLRVSEPQVAHALAGNVEVSRRLVVRLLKGLNPARHEGEVDLDANSVMAGAVLSFEDYGL